MGITKVQQATLTKNYKIDEVHLTSIAKGVHIATISFIILDENNERIGTECIQYSGADYNEFWESFNSGKYLYDLLNSEKQLNLEVPPEVEDEFICTPILIPEMPVEDEVPVEDEN